MPRLPMTPVDMTPEAPGELRRLLRFGKIAVGPRRKLEDVFAMLLQDLRDSGVPDEAINAIEKKGVKFLKQGSVASSIEKLAGTPENVHQVKSSLSAARSAVRGISKGDLTKQFERFLSVLKAESPESLGDDAGRIVEEFRKLGPKKTAQLGARTVLSGMATRADQPVVANLLRQAARQAPYPQVAESIKTVLEQTGGAEVTAAQRTAMAGAGVKGVSRAAELGRKGLGLLGKTPLSAGLGALGIGFGVSRAFNMLGKGARAREMARTGFGALGPQSSSEYLRDRINAQETLNRRKIVMTQYEPQLFNEVVRVLATEGLPEGSLTATERNIGTAAGGAAAGQRTSKDVQLLLDTLLSQMGQ